MNKLKELRKKVRKNNKGFSLVELIVVIVILAILIGVTIGGIYQYVNKSRVNTDINNAASIQSVLATLATDNDVNTAFGNVTSNKSVYVQWSEAKPIDKPASISASGDEKIKDTIKTKLADLLTDGLPESKSNNEFEIAITKDSNGNVSATCKVYKVDTPATEVTYTTEKSIHTTGENDNTLTAK